MSVPMIVVHGVTPPRSTIPLPPLRSALNLHVSTIFHHVTVHALLRSVISHVVPVAHPLVRNVNVMLYLLRRSAKVALTVRVLVRNAVAVVDVPPNYLNYSFDVTSNGKVTDVNVGRRDNKWYNVQVLPEMV